MYPFLLALALAGTGADANLSDTEGSVARPSPCVAHDLNLQPGFLGLVPARREGRAIVKSLVIDGPGERAGLEVGDSLLALDGAAIGASSDLSVRSALRCAAESRPAELAIERNGQVLSVTVIPESTPIAFRTALDAWFEEAKVDPNAPTCLPEESALPLRATPREADRD